jgi:hypothetical protein
MYAALLSLSLHPPPPRTPLGRNSKKLNGVDEKFGKLLKGMDDELKDLKEVTNKMKEDDQKDDEADRKVKRGREEEFAMQIGLLRRVTSRSCMRNTSAPCVAFGADRALVKLAER